MDENLTFWSLVALSVGILTWGVVQVFMGLFVPNKTLEERLAAGIKREMSSNIGRLSLQDQMDELPPILAAIPMLQTFSARLRQAFPDVTLKRFLSLTCLTAGGAFAAVTWLHSPVAGGIAAMVGAAVPFVVVNIARAKRQIILTDQLIDALDFLARVMRAGHSLNTGIQMIGDEMPDPIAAEFRRCHHQNSLGQPMEQSMLEMAKRVDSKDFAFFVTSVLIQRQTGGDLAELLDNICTVVRNRIRLRQHVKALTGEGRLTGALLTALPPALLAILFVLNRQYVEPLIYRPTGRMLLGGMLVLQLIGLAIMKKIVNVKV